MNIEKLKERETEKRLKEMRKKEKERIKKIIGNEKITDDDVIGCMDIVSDYVPVGKVMSELMDENNHMYPQESMMNICCSPEYYAACYIVRSLHDSDEWEEDWYEDEDITDKKAFSECLADGWDTIKDYLIDAMYDYEKGDEYDEDDKHLLDNKKIERLVRRNFEAERLGLHIS